MMKSLRYEAESLRISAKDDSVKKLAEIVSHVCQLCDKLQDTVEVLSKDYRRGNGDRK